MHNFIICSLKTNTTKLEATANAQKSPIMLQSYPKSKYFIRSNDIAWTLSLTSLPKILFFFFG